MTNKAYKKKLTDYISERVAISETEKELIAESYSILEVKKKKFLSQEGQKCLLEGFVVKGSFRIFHNDSKGLEHVLYFAFENWWVGDMAAYLTGEPSTINIQAMEDSVLLVIDPIKKEELFQKVPALERLFRIIVQKHLVVLQKRFLLTVSEHAIERYKELIERHPGIEQLVPQHQIASYLGILPESLSRMKKQMHGDKKG